jgi:hypothetical protein
MKNMITIFSAIFTIVSFHTIDAQNKFEGIVNMKNTTEQELEITFTLKDNLALMETQTDHGKIHILFDETTGDMTTITEKDGERLAIKMNMNNNPYVSQMNNNEVQTKNISKKTAEVIVTKEKKTIHGFECVKVIGKDKNSEGEAWIAKELDLDMADLVPQAKKYMNQDKTMRAFTGVDGFIMEMKMKDLKTGKEYTIENEVIQQPIPESIFKALTENVEIFDMTDMRQIMLDAQKNPEKMQKMREMMMKMNE